MATLSTNLKLILLALGESAYGAFADWGAVTNDNLSNLEEAISSREDITINIADVTMTDAQARAIYLNLTGAMTGNRNLIVPTREKLYFVSNLTTGDFDLVVKTAAGTGVTLKNGQALFVYCDGTNVIAINGWSYFSNSDGVSIRHPSGLQICLGRKTGGNTNGGSAPPYINSPVTWDFPQVFKAGTYPFAYGSCHTDGVSLQRWIVSNSTTIGSYSYYKAGMTKSSTNSDPVNLFAIGFWR